MIFKFCMVLRNPCLNFAVFSIGCVNSLTLYCYSVNFDSSNDLLQESAIASSSEIAAGTTTSDRVTQAFAVDLGYL